MITQAGLAEDRNEKEKKEKSKISYTFTSDGLFDWQSLKTGNESVQARVEMHQGFPKAGLEFVMSQKHLNEQFQNLLEIILWYMIVRIFVLFWNALGEIINPELQNKIP